MESNTETKALTDLIENPSEISSIINNPADSGVKFYQSLRTKDKQYVAFAAGLGLIGYGIYLNRTSKPSGTAKSSQATGNQSDQPEGTSGGGTNTFHVKKKKK